MGYQTYFNGELEITPPLKPEVVEYINKFSGTRRVKRDAAIATLLPDPLRAAVNLPIGIDAGYFVGGSGFCGQDRDASTLDYNGPPTGQPGVWCQWEVREDGKKLCWDEGEKFYNYVEWLQYLISHFFGPWGYKLNGQIGWKGAEASDMGIIHVKDNKVQAIDTQLIDREPVWDEAV